jgi:arrestin-related trafficking adapter 4/5/7
MATHGAKHRLIHSRLDDDYIVFRGNEEEAASAHLRGKLILCLAEPLTIKYIRLTLTGLSKIA